MKKFSKKIASLISGLLPLLSLSTKTKAMKTMKEYLAPLFYTRSNCPVGHIAKAPDNVVNQMIKDALTLSPEEHKNELKGYETKYHMHPYPIQVIGLRALNKISNNPKTTAAVAVSIIGLPLAYKYDVFNTLGEIVKNLMFDNKAQFEDYEDYEVIVLNDASPENLESVVEQYFDNPKLKYYKNDCNK